MWRFLLGGNLRNGSNAGSAYVNCRNDLGNDRWNYAARNCYSIFLFFIASYFVTRKGHNVSSQASAKILFINHGVSKY